MKRKGEINIFVFVVIFVILMTFPSVDFSNDENNSTKIDKTNSK